MTPALGILCGLALGWPGDQDEAELKKLLLPLYTREAAGYEFFLDDAHEQPLKLRTAPLLVWTNAEGYMGAVYVWTYEGRPEIIGCVGSDQNQTGVAKVFHEFHALTERPLPATNLGGGIRRWEAEKPGVNLLPLEGAAKPADSERLRLTQMRSLAREFETSMRDGQDVTQLRLLTQPIFRYRSPDRGVVDGAIFSFVWKGTDPEVLLILEDRVVDSAPQWRFGLARFNWRPLQADWKGKEVWRVEQLPDLAGVQTLRDYYVTILVKDVPLDSLEPADAGEE